MRTWQEVLVTVFTTTEFHGGIFDVSSVLIDSPHCQSWQAALEELMEGEWSDIRDQSSYSPERFTRAVYQQFIAHLPRLAGARGTLEYFGVPDFERRAERYAEVKRDLVTKLIEQGQFAAFPDALRFILAVKDLGIPVAAVSLSKNTKKLLGRIEVGAFAAEQGLDYSFIHPGMVLSQLLDVEISGRDFPGHERDAAIFLAAADELGAAPERCFVVDDTAAGVGAAKEKAMAALGIARHGDEELLRTAGAGLVVTSLDDVSRDALADGRLADRPDSGVPGGPQQDRPPGAWSLVYEGFDPAQQGLREALCALGNGYFVTRGALPEARADSVHYPGTYVAGLYNRLQTEVAGRTIENEDLVNLPNWLSLSFRLADGPWFDIQQADVLDHRLELDLRRGMLTRRLRWKDEAGRRTGMVQRRFVSMKDPHLAGLETTFTAENWSGALEVRSGVDGRIINSGVPRYRDLSRRHLVVLHAAEADEETVELQAETNQSHVRIAVVSRTRVLTGGVPTAAGRRPVAEPGFIAQVLTLSLEPNRPATVEKITALYTSRDRAISESLLEARQAVLAAATFADLAARHAAAWGRLWRRFDIRLDSTSDWAETVLHLHIFHLLQTVSPNSLPLDAGVPARGWHGEAYRGHIFWDEVFIFPVFNFQHTLLAASLLDYRQERLGAARRAASAAGYRGAMFPWQSGSDGREESQRLHLNPQSGRWLPDHSHLQRHVSIAVAYNVWQHYVVTGSVQFLRFSGAEMLIEVARFLASLATYNPQLDRYEILGVIGPDEYHDAYPDRDQPGVDNNTYTNVMTAWVLRRAMQALDELPPHYRQEVAGELALGVEELQRWRDIAGKMRVIFHQDGVLTQFEGYEQLQEFDWAGYRDKYGNIQRLDRVLEAEGDSTNRYKITKQADVLMLRDLLRSLGYELTREQLARTIAYYHDRTAHGSTLSGVVSAWVLSRTDPAQAWQFLLRVLQSDVADVQGGTTAEGIHLGAMAGTLCLVMSGLTGMNARGDTLRFDPVLPPEVRYLRYSVHYRGHRIEITLNEDGISLRSRPGRAAPIKIIVRHQTRELAPGTHLAFRLAAPPPGRAPADGLPA